MMDRFVMHMFYNEFFFFFQLAPMLLVYEFHVCIWRGTIITLLQFFFFCV